MQTNQATEYRKKLLTYFKLICGFLSKECSRFDEYFPYPFIVSFFYGNRKIHKSFKAVETLDNIGFPKRRLHQYGAFHSTHFNLTQNE